jgi:hypothetical protein
MPGVDHRSRKGLYNRVENSHLAVRRRGWGMIQFKSAGQCQRFISIYGQSPTSEGKSRLDAPVVILPAGQGADAWHNHSWEQQ